MEKDKTENPSTDPVYLVRYGTTPLYFIGKIGGFSWTADSYDLIRYIGVTREHSLEQLRINFHRYMLRDTDHYLLEGEALQNVMKYFEKSDKLEAMNNQRGLIASNYSVDMNIFIYIITHYEELLPLIKATTLMSLIAMKEKEGR